VCREVVARARRGVPPRPPPHRRLRQLRRGTPRDAPGMAGKGRGSRGTARTRRSPARCKRWSAIAAPLIYSTSTSTIASGGHRSIPWRAAGGGADRRLQEGVTFPSGGSEHPALTAYLWGCGRAGARGDDGPVCGRPRPCRKQGRELPPPGFDRPLPLFARPRPLPPDGRQRILLPDALDPRLDPASQPVRLRRLLSSHLCAAFTAAAYQDHDDPVPRRKA